MKFPLSTGRLASFSARRPWWVVGIWVAFLAASIIAFPGLSHALTANEMQFLNNPDSVKAEKLLEERQRAASQDAARPDCSQKMSVGRF